EIQLRVEPRSNGLAGRGELDMRRPPRIRAVAPGIGAGLDRQKAVLARGIRDRLPRAGKIGVERRVVLVDRMMVAPGRIALPQLNQSARHRPPVLVKDAALEAHALA